MVLETELLLLVHNYGLFGLFIAELLCTASIFIPTPGSLIILAGSQIFGPLATALVGGFGAGVGELSAYIIAREGRLLLNKEQRKRVDAYRDKVGKWGFLAIFFFSCLPFFPIDFVSIASGLLKYNATKYTIAVLLGRMVYAFILAYTGHTLLNGFLLFIPVG